MLMSHVIHNGYHIWRPDKHHNMSMQLLVEPCECCTCCIITTITLNAIIFTSQAQLRPHLPSGGGCSTRLPAYSTMACASDTLRRPLPGCAPLKMSRNTPPCSTDSCGPGSTMCLQCQLPPLKMSCDTPPCSTAVVNQLIRPPG
jgi:hypothetical protein